VPITKPKKLIVTDKEGTEYEFASMKEAVEAIGKDQISKIRSEK
jgi:hypothetical protein